MAKPKSSRRPRDYKAEYKRRLARGKKQGKTRQQARGHRPKEHVERRRKSEQKYGASPSTLTGLRKQAFDKLMAIYQTQALNPVSDKTVRKGMKMLHAEDLRALIDRDNVEIINRASVQAAFTDSKGVYHRSYIDQLAEDFPVSIDELVAVDYNPYWYHRS